MKRSGWLGLALFLVGCGSAVLEGGNGGRDGGKPGPGPQPRLDGGGGGDGGGQVANPCSGFDPSCTIVSFGPGAGKTFPLPGDQPADPSVESDGVGRDGNGWLGLDHSRASFDFLWLANTSDWGRGTVSKLSTKSLQEVARYPSVTCHSLKTGSKAACDGQAGCCAIDSHAQYQRRLGGQPSGAAQKVQLSDNDPSRTAVDFNGDVWVANRAFSGQSSVTKIANDPRDCTDRNGNGRVDTSRDVNHDGVIQTDCNGDNLPDDLDSVKGRPCGNGQPQEYFGLDDECVLFTTNFNAPQQYGRPLSLGPGASDFGPSDAWAGGFQDGEFFRIDGQSGQIKASAKLPGGCRPYGLAVDATAIAWAPPLGSGGPLCYFNARNPAEVGTVRNPNSGAANGYGISLDRDQNVWLGGWTTSNVYRYTPDRKNGFAGLGKGYWTVIQRPGEGAGARGNRRGIAVDNRSANTFFAWVATDSGFITRLEASSLALPAGQDRTVDGSGWPALKVAGSNTIGVGVDRDQNVWGVSLSGTVATRIQVDQNGQMTPPDLKSAAKQGERCPAGDRCAYQDNGRSEPSPYTYSDFTGFGLRNFTRPKGSWSYLVKGCENAKETKWLKVIWDGEVPPNTSLTVRARAGKARDLLGPWSTDFAVSLADLVAGEPLGPTQRELYLQVEVDFATTAKDVTPKLKRLDVLYECPGGIG